MNEDMFIDSSSFIRSFEVKPKGALAFLIGAGASVHAGIPSAGQLIWEFKRRLYCDDKGILPEKYRDLQSEKTQNEIQSHFNGRPGFPSLGSSDEYSFYFEKCYPESQDRKNFLQLRVEGKPPS